MGCLGILRRRQGMGGIDQDRRRELCEDKLRVWSVLSGKDPQPIAWDMRSHTAEFTAAAEMVEGEIRNASFRHDGDGSLGRHVVQARRRPNRWGVSIGKESPKSPRKIDAAVAMIIARHVRRLVLASKVWKEHQDQVKSGKPVNGGSRVWSFS